MGRDMPAKALPMGTSCCLRRRQRTNLPQTAGASATWVTSFRRGRVTAQVACSPSLFPSGKTRSCPRVRARRARPYRERTHMPVVSRGQRNTSLICEEVVVARGYQRLTPATIDRDLGPAAGRAGGEADRAGSWDFRPGTVRAYLVRCGGIRPEPRRRAAGRLRFEEREEISRGLAAGRSFRAIAAGLGRSPSTVSREVAGQRWSAAVSGRACRSAGVGSGHPAEGMQAGRQPGAALTSWRRSSADGGRRSRSPAG